MTEPQRLTVDLGARAYPVWVGPGLVERTAELIERPAAAEAAAIVTDANVAALHGARARGGLGSWGIRLEQLTLEPGEAGKTIATADAVWRWMASVDLHRADVVVALGGGVVGDLAGFTAAGYHRGIAWIALPTTLLAMVDAAIGGKTAVDLPEGKNLVGAFHQPLGVVADTTLLGTLEDGAFATGLAETIKHGLIARPDLLDRIRSEHERILRRDPDVMTPLVADAAAVKIRVVEADETDRGMRAHLNYGHTLAHALETLGEYRRWTHGEAVAIGMTFAAHLAAGLGHADRVSEHRQALEAFGLPTAGAGFGFEDVARAWRGDKKYEQGMRFVVLEDLGKPVIARDVPEDALRAAYEAVR